MLWGEFGGYKPISFIQPAQCTIQKQIIFCSLLIWKRNSLKLSFVRTEEKRKRLLS